jgi:hypothetical protein
VLVFACCSDLSPGFFSICCWLYDLGLILSVTDAGMVEPESFVVCHLLALCGLFCLIYFELSILVCNLEIDPCWLE